MSDQPFLDILCMFYLYQQVLSGHEYLQATDQRSTQVWGKSAREGHPCLFLVQLGWLGKESLVRFLASAGSPYGWLTITVGHTKWKNKCGTVTTQSDRLKEYGNHRMRTFLTSLMALENQIKNPACQHGNMSEQTQISESDRRYVEWEFVCDI